MTDKIVVPLTTPIEAFGEPVTALELRRPRFRDIRDVQLTITAEGIKFSFDALITTIAALAKLPVASIGELDIADVQAVGAAVLPLLSPLAAIQQGSPPSS